MTGRTLQSFKHRIQMLRNFVLNSFTNISFLDCNERWQTSTFYNISLWYTEWREKLWYLVILSISYHRKYLLINMNEPNSKLYWEMFPCSLVCLSRRFRSEQWEYSTFPSLNLMTLFSLFDSLLSRWTDIMPKTAFGQTVENRFRSKCRKRNSKLSA